MSGFDWVKAARDLRGVSVKVDGEDIKLRLYPCPFCGGQERFGGKPAAVPVREEVKTPRGIVTQWRIRCSLCGGQSGAVVASRPESGQIYANATAVRIAARKWNLRNWAPPRLPRVKKQPERTPGAVERRKREIKTDQERDGYISISEYARRHGKAASNVRRKAVAGDFESAIKIGRNWLIEADEPYIDNRIKTGKYVKKKRGE